MSVLHIYFKKNIFYLKFFLYFNKTNIKNLKFYDFYFIFINLLKNTEIFNRTI